MARISRIRGYLTSEIASYLGTAYATYMRLSGYSQNGFLDILVNVNLGMTCGFLMRRLTSGSTLPEAQKNIITLGFVSAISATKEVLDTFLPKAIFSEAVRNLFSGNGSANDFLWNVAGGMAVILTPYLIRIIKENLDSNQHINP